MIIDTHVYCLPPRLQDPNVNLPQDEFAVQNAIYKHKDSPLALKLSSKTEIEKSMQESGIAQSILIAFPWKNPQLCHETNEYLLEVCTNHTHFQCLTSIQPKSKNWFREAESCLKAGALGFKINPGWQDFHLDDPEMNEFARFVIEKKSFVMIHTDQAYRISNTTAGHILALASRHPDLKIISSHMGGLLGLYNNHPPIAEKIKNVYFDTAVSSTLIMIDFYLQSGLQDRIFFGSDFPFNHSHSQKQLIEDLEKSALFQKAKEKIYYQNYQNFLKL